MSNKRKLTTSAGCPVAGSQNELGAGPRGPQLLQDVWFLRRLTRLDRAAFPERRKHSKIFSLPVALHHYARFSEIYPGQGVYPVRNNEF